jgi:hypothetical protein
MELEIPAVRRIITRLWAAEEDSALIRAFFLDHAVRFHAAIFAKAWFIFVPCDAFFCGCEKKLTIGKLHQRIFACSE